MMGNKWFRSLVAPITLVAAGILAAPAFAQTWSGRWESTDSTVPAEEGGGGGGKRVLFVVGDSSTAYATIRNGVAALPEIAVANTFDSSGATPSLDLLSTYSCVFVWANFPHSDPVALGNVLADYVDNGGAVIASTPSRIAGAFFIGGRLLSGAYDPMFNGSGPNGPATLGTFVPDHPAMTTPYMITSLMGDFRESVSLRPGVDDVARWSDNLPLLAINGNGKVAGDTAFLHDTYWSGQFPQLLVNLCVYLTPCSGG